MFKKVLILIALAVGLGGFLFFRKYLNKPIPSPQLVDRLPEADFLARVYLLDVSKNATDMLFYNKMPFRDMFSYDFILGKAKGFGLDVQNPTYMFADENGNWGAMIKVVDSSKVGQGLLGLRKNIDIKSKLYGKQVTHQLGKDSTFLAYGKDWLLYYSGSDFDSKIKHITEAYRGSANAEWKSFLSEKNFSKESLVVYSNWKRLKKYGVKTALFSIQSDSVSLSLKAYLKSTEDWGFQLKDTGFALSANKETTNKIDLHFDITNRENLKNTIFQKILNEVGKKISFPSDAFFEAWNGDISILIGGTQLIKEKYIVSEMDDNFEITEVVKFQDIEVPAFSVLMSTNEYNDKFIAQLFSKGIVTKDNDKYRLLFSPPLNLRKKKEYLMFYSGDRPPQIQDTVLNSGYWNHENTKYNFRLDSMTNNEMYGNIIIPIREILKKKRLIR